MTELGAIYRFLAWRNKVIQRGAHFLINDVLALRNARRVEVTKDGIVNLDNGVVVTPRMFWELMESIA